MTGPPERMVFPPTAGYFSRTIALEPFCSAVAAALSPAPPPPTTTTSQVYSSSSLIKLLAGLDVS